MVAAPAWLDPNVASTGDEIPDDIPNVYEEGSVDVSYKLPLMTGFSPRLSIEFGVTTGVVLRRIVTSGSPVGGPESGAKGRPMGERMCNP